MAKITKSENKIKLIQQGFFDKATPSQYGMLMAFNKKLGEEYTEHFGEDYEWDNIPFKKRTFRSWLRPLVIMSDCMIHGRWTYWLDIVATQKVEGKPIPKLNFLHSCDEGYKMAEENIKSCLNPPNAGGLGSYQVFNYFVDWLLYGFGSSLVTSLPPIADELNEYWYRTFKADLLLMFPADYWVMIASQMYSGKSFNANAFYPTPGHVVACMTEMVFMGSTPEQVELQKYDRFMEPCCGSGIMVLYASNHSLRLYATDIDLLMTKLCTLNCYLYAPWAVEMDKQTEDLLEETKIRLSNKEVIA